MRELEEEASKKNMKDKRIKLGKSTKNLKGKELLANSDVITLKDL